MAKKRTSIARVKKQTSDAKYLGATVSTAERAAPRWKPTEAVQLVKRLQQFVLWCCMFNSQNAAQHKLRMYRKTGSPGSKVWRGRVVKGVKRNDYLRNPQPGYGPGLKAAGYADDSDDIEEVLDHPFLDLFNNANPWQRGNQFSKANFFQWMAFGANYLHCVQEPNNTPKELWVMGAQWVRPIPNKDDLIDGWMYGRDRTVEQMFTLDEVVPRIWFPNPFNPYTGICPLHAALDEADLYRAYTDGDLSSQKNGARPDFVMKFPQGATADQMDQARAEVEKRHRGPLRRGDFFMARDVEVMPLGFSPKEMENLAGRSNCLSLTAAMYGIPEGFWKGNDTKKAGSDSMHEQYGRYTMGPMLNQDAEEWTEFLARYGTEPGEYWLAYDDPCPENRDLMRQEIDTYIKAKVITPNEARGWLGLEAIEGGDEMAADPVPAGQQQPGDDKDEKPAPPKKDKAFPVIKAQIENSAYDVFRNAIEAIIRAWLTDIQGQDNVPDMFEELAEYYPILAAKLTTPIGGAMRMGSTEGFLAIHQEPMDLFGPDTGATKFLQNYTIRLSKEITGTTVEDIRDVLKNQIAETASLGERTAAVRQLMEDQKVYRPAMIARTETARAQNHGQIEAWKANGIKRVKWVLAPGACPVCQAFVDTFGEERPIDEPFAKVGDSYTVPGAKKAIDITYASGGMDDGIWAPPAHPSCRCGLDAVLTPLEKP